jgi:hypothetical protein
MFLRNAGGFHWTSWRIFQKIELYTAKSVSCSLVKAFVMSITLYSSVSSSRTLRVIMFLAVPLLEVLMLLFQHFFFVHIFLETLKATL